MLEGRPTGEVILAHAKALGCDLVIQGAYTQSRLRQMIFGGTTRTFSAMKCPVCIENVIRFDCVAESHNVSANGGADILLAVGHPDVTVRSSCPDSPPAPADHDLLNDRVSLDTP